MWAACLLVGCGEPATTEPAPNAGSRPYSGVKLRVVLDGMPRDSGAIGRLATEWENASGCVLEFYKLPSRDPAGGPAAAAEAGDVFLAAPTQLGDLVEQGLARPLGRSLLETDSLAWPDVLESVRAQLVTWGRDVRALPAGHPTLVLYYRADLLEKLGRSPPNTWSEYQEVAALLAELIGEPEAGGATIRYACCEPLAAGWGATLLLARTAAYAQHPSQYSALFDLESLTPLIASPPFVRGLDELVASRQLGPAESLLPDQVRARFLAGECGLGLAWPAAGLGVAWPAAGLAEAAAPSVAFPVGFAPLPGSSEAFNPSTQAWESLAGGEPRRVPLLGFAGLIGTVAENSNQAEAASQFLLWLAEGTRGSRLAAAQGQTGPFRMSHLRMPKSWVESTHSADEAAAYAAAAEASLTAESALVYPRWPHATEYLAALDSAVSQAAAGELPPDQALAGVAAQWEKLTEQFGRAKQLAGYRLSLGLEP